MKAAGLAVFAILGVGLILAPLISDHVRQATAARLLEHRPDLKAVDLGPGMNLAYRVLCWVAGGLMILVAAMFGADKAPEGERSWKSYAALAAVAAVLAVCLVAGYFLWTS
jgi:hypothetical protein